MITEDYVSFEIAKLLKEKGFAEVTPMWYNKKGEPEMRGTAAHTSDVTDAPTLQSVMKWLREIHNIHIEIGYNMGYFPVCISTKTNDTIPYIAMGSPFTYEKACEAAIKYCLEYLI